MICNKILLAAALYVTAVAPTVYGRGETEVRVTRQSQIASGITAEKMTPYSHRRVIKAYGEVVDLSSLIEMMDNFAAAKAQSLKANLQLVLSRNEYERAAKLFKSHNLVSLENLQNAEGAYEADLADSQAAARAMQGLNGEIIQEWGNVVAGWISSNSRSAAALVSHRISLIVITIPRIRREFRPPDVAEVETVNGSSVRASLVSASPVTGSNIHGLSYIYQAGSLPSLPAGMNIVASLPDGKRETGVVVPRSSVVWLNGKSWVFVKTGSDEFVRKEIRTGDSAGGGWFIDRGIVPGEEVVVKGAQLLLSQELKSSMRAGDD